MNLKFTKLAQQILGEASHDLGHDRDQTPSKPGKSAFRRREMNAGEVRGKGPEKPYVVYGEDGDPVANYKTEDEARAHAKRIGGRVKMAR